MEWTQQNLWRLVNNTMYQTKPDSASKIEIIFTWRQDKIIPIIHTYPSNRVICDAVNIEVEE